MPTQAAVRVPAMPMLRYVLLAWGLVLTAVPVLIGVTSLPHDPGAALSCALLAAVGAWLTRRWWVTGADVSADTVRMRGAWRSRTFPRHPNLAVECRKRGTSWSRRLLLGDWAGYEMVVTTEAGPAHLGGIGLTFQSFEPGAAFADRIHQAMAARP